MATDSIRKQAVANLVTQIAAVNGSPTYFTVLTGTGQVSSLVQTRNQRRAQPFKHWVYVYDGAEQFSSRDATGDNYESALELIIVCIVQDESDESMVNELNDLLHDVQLALGTDTTLGGVVGNLRANSVESPIYNSSDSEGIAVLHALCVYDFEMGSTI